MAPAPVLTPVSARVWVWMRERVRVRVWVRVWVRVRVRVRVTVRVPVPVRWVVPAFGGFR